MKLRLVCAPAAACLLLGALASPARAQITTATVAGSVKDAQGGAIPGATVTLISETRGTKLVDAITSATGDFVFPSVAGDTYTVQVAMSGFKTLKRTGVVVTPGDRVAVGSLTVEIGGLTDTVEVRAETPQIQATSGEQSFVIDTDAVANLPLATRSFTALAELAPGVTGTSRIGDRSSTGGGNSNVMMDGVSTMDTGSNRPLVEMNVESIAQVKVLTSSYQAEYGRSSGLQITAVTKTGTNRIRGSGYDVERNSAWNENSKVNKLNGDPKPVSKQRDWGYSIGGPIGRPGGRNKLFFFYSHEYEPRAAGNDVVRYRLPTALEREGDFSQTVDNNGNLYPYIRDTQVTGTCSSTNQTSCFADGGVFGRIPTSRLYQTGLNILRMYPMPNLTGQVYNYQLTRPTEHILGYQPALRFDYQPAQRLRFSVKWGGFMQRKQNINGSLPGFNDTRVPNPVVTTLALNANYTLNPSTFLEVTYGHAQNEQAGCSVGVGGPSFCTSGLAINPGANRNTIGLGGLPFLFPTANVIDPRYYAFRALSSIDPPMWDGSEILQPPSFTWGGRVSNGTNAPPSIGFPGFLNVNSTNDIAISLTKVAGRHTMKTGFYNTHSYKAQQRTGSFGTLTFSNDSSNPLDSTYGFSNAALGVFSSYNQASKYVEGVFLYNNTEGYIQDNWKVSRKLTLDYGVRLVHQQPQYDTLGQASNFLPEKWSVDNAPLLFVPGCTITVAAGTACPTANRQAMNPVTGQFLGANSTLGIAQLIPGTGNLTNGLFVSGQGIAKTTYTWPGLGIAPRFGIAYDLSGRQRLVLRGGGGLYFDRPSGNSIFSQVSNPPASRNVTVRYGQLQTLGAQGLTTEGPPALNVYEYNAKLPSSVQWNAGMQMALPWYTTLDVSYTGQHGYNIVETVNLNAVDFGAAFLPQNQDTTVVPSATPGASALSQDLMRSYRGYGSITQSLGRGWITFHALQLTFNRRFRNGVSFGFNSSIGLSARGSTNIRLQHNPDGSYFVRPDQGVADTLLQAKPQRNIMKANFVWDLPDIRRGNRLLRTVGLVVNDWQLSGIWTGRSSTAYTVGFSYQSGGGNVNLTGSPDYGARVRVVGDPGTGCSRNVYRQFNTAAFQGPLTGSAGLESGNDYVHGCLTSTLDLAIARNIRFPHSRTIQLRVDMFNAPNSASITGRNATMNLSNPNDPVTVTNLPFDAAGALIASRSLPRGAGFGVASNYQNPRTLQAQIRFSF